MKYSNNMVDTMLIHTSITRLGEVIDSQTPIKWSCNGCNHVWETSPTKIIASGTRCPKCSYISRGVSRRWTNELVDGKLHQKNKQITRLGSLASGKDIIGWKCNKCLHVWRTTSISILTSNTGCPKCWQSMRDQLAQKRAYTENDIKLKIRENHLDLVGKYEGMLIKTRWRCTNDHIWEARPNDIINNNSHCPHCVPRSYSKKCISWLTYIMASDGVNIQHAENGGEFLIPGTRYRADGYCKDTNTIYEFYGDVYHGNLCIFSPTDHCHPFNNKTAQQLNDETIKREQLITFKGFKLRTIWESEWRN